MARFGSKVGQIGPKCDKSGSFSDQISEHLGSARQNVLKSVLKSPGTVPFGANLTYFWPKSDHDAGVVVMGCLSLPWSKLI